MRTKLVRIGNSRGIRLPHTVIAEAGLTDDVELTVRKGVVTVRPVRSLREGWEEAAKECHANGDDGLILGDLGTEFDKEW